MNTDQILRIASAAGISGEKLERFKAMLELYAQGVEDGKREQQTVTPVPYWPITPATPPQIIYGNEPPGLWPRITCGADVIFCGGNA